MTVAIIDYGMSNLGSVRRALGILGAEVMVADRPELLAPSVGIILPGVGGFSEGMARLNERGWPDAIRKHVQFGTPVLGICLGMQLLASVGSEGGETAGLDLVPGSVVRLDRLGCLKRIPHVGWNSVSINSPRRKLFHAIPDGTDFYFVHSYAFSASDRGDVAAETDYGVPVTAAVARARVFGTQFHPEKSSRAGSRILKNFLEVIC